MRTAERVMVAQPRRTASARPALRLWGEQGVLYPLMYLVPFLIFFIAFEIYPIFEGLYVSLTAWDLLTDPRWVGLANYTALLKDSLFQTSLRNTVLFVALDAPLAVVIPLGLAMLVNENMPGRTLFRSAFVAPLMISASSVGVLWQWFYNPAFGLINYYALMIGLPGQHWLSEAGWATFAIVLTTVWWTSGFNMVLFLAGLQNIPQHLYDAAKVDGAGPVGAVPQHHLAWFAADQPVRWRDDDHRGIPCLRPDPGDDQQFGRSIRFHPLAGHASVSDGVSVLQDGRGLGRGLGAVPDRFGVHADSVPDAAWVRRLNEEELTGPWRVQN